MSGFYFIIRNQQQNLEFQESSGKVTIAEKEKNNILYVPENILREFNKRKTGNLPIFIIRLDNETYDSFDQYLQDVSANNNELTIDSELDMYKYCISLDAKKTDFYHFLVEINI
jgi:hypothetical protein